MARLVLCHGGASQEKVRPYQHFITSDDVQLAASHIKIVHEDLGDGRDKEFERARKLLNSAEQVALWVLDMIRLM